MVWTLSCEDLLSSVSCSSHENNPTVLSSTRRMYVCLRSSHSRSLISSNIQQEKFDSARFELHQLLAQPTLKGVPLLVVRHFTITTRINTQTDSVAREQERSGGSRICQRTNQGFVSYPSCLETCSQSCNAMYCSFAGSSTKYKTGLFRYAFHLLFRFFASQH